MPIAARWHVQSKASCWVPAATAQGRGRGRRETQTHVLAVPRGALRKAPHPLATRSSGNPQPSPVLQRPLGRGKGRLKHPHLQTTKCYLNPRHHRFTITVKSDSSTISFSVLLPGIFITVCFRVFLGLGCYAEVVAQLRSIKSNRYPSSAGRDSARGTAMVQPLRTSPQAPVWVYRLPMEGSSPSTTTPKRSPIRILIMAGAAVLDSVMLGDSPLPEWPWSCAILQPSEPVTTAVGLGVSP